MYNNYLKTLILIFSALLQFDFVINQETADALACTQYKKSIFEETKEFSILLKGAPIIKKTIDRCHTYAPFIVDGSPAVPKEFPLAARIGIISSDPNVPTRWECGGTLINKRWVLTAAHCFDIEGAEINVVRLGDLDFRTDKEDAKPKDYKIRNYIAHEEYGKSETLYNDIGLIELDEDVVFDYYKHPACLPFTDGSEQDTYIAIGWGSQKTAGDNSDKLLKVKLDRFSSDACKAIKSDDFPNGHDPITQLCVGSKETKDTCNGDSGGPLLVYHKDYPCMYHVYGITSAGIGGCGTANEPSVYTRVHPYLDWIKEKISK